MSFWRYGDTAWMAYSRIGRMRLRKRGRYTLSTNTTNPIKQLVDWLKRFFRNSRFVITIETILRVAWEGSSVKRTHKRFVFPLHLKYKLTFTEDSKISDLNCYQRVVGKRQVVCLWVATPPVSFYEVVFSTPEGSKLFRMIVKNQRARTEFDISFGNIIMVSVNDASTMFQFAGMFS